LPSSSRRLPFNRRHLFHKEHGEALRHRRGRG
jgi:hypothetical protein